MTLKTPYTATEVRGHITFRIIAEAHSRVVAKAPNARFVTPDMKFDEATKGQLLAIINAERKDLNRLMEIEYPEIKVSHLVWPKPEEATLHDVFNVIHQVDMSPQDNRLLAPLEFQKVWETLTALSAMVRLNEYQVSFFVGEGDSAKIVLNYHVRLRGNEEHEVVVSYHPVPYIGDQYIKVENHVSLTDFYHAYAPKYKEVLNAD